MGIRYAWLLLLVAVTAQGKSAGSDAEQGRSETACLPIEYRIHPIFDEQAEDTIWLHRLANALHIDTREVALANEMAFLNPCQPTARELAEVERHLRGRRYLRDARVTEVTADDGRRHIRVETWDNWSMMPTVDFGRKGGKNKYAFGIKDRNLLGLAIDANLEYFSNFQRSGYKLEAALPLYLHHNITVDVRLSDTDDGNQYQLFVNKPFVALTTEQAFVLGFNKESRVEQIFQNVSDSYAFGQQLRQWQLGYGWLLDYDAATASAWRLSAGIRQDQNLFGQLAGETRPLPQDRDYLYGYVGLEFERDSYQERKNFYLINQTEDINFGWQWQFRLGLGRDRASNAQLLRYDFSAAKATPLSERQTVLWQLAIEGDKVSAQSARFLGHSQLEWFWFPSSRWGLYARGAVWHGRNQYRDLPVTLGGDNGLRGYPLQYQHGNTAMLVTLEGRYYPHINIYRLFELGGAVFVDLGRTSGRPLLANDESGWLPAVGVGARFYSTRSAEGQVVHVDLVYPLSDNPDIGGLELRIETRHSF